MTTSEVLNAAADIVEKSWTTGAQARDAQGNKIWASAPTAVTWCVVGAIEKASGRKYLVHPFIFLKDFLHSDIALWNDAPGRTQAEVVAALREAARTAIESHPHGAGLEGARDPRHDA